MPFFTYGQIADVCMLADRVLCADDGHSKGRLRSGPRRHSTPSSELGPGSESSFVLRALLEDELTQSEPACIVAGIFGVSRRLIGTAHG